MIVDSEIWRWHCKGLTVPEIAARLNVPEQGVRKAIVTCWGLDFDARKFFGDRRPDDA